MGFEFTLPAAADGSGSCSELTGDDPYNVCSEALIIRSPEILTAEKKSSAQCGFDIILAPTEGISHSRLEDMGFDDEFAELLQGALCDRGSEGVDRESRGGTRRTNCLERRS